jgi:hypothetical protein
MTPKRRPGRVPPPLSAEEETIDGIAHPPVYPGPMPANVTRVMPVPGDEWIVGTAGPPMNPEQAKAWRESRRKQPTPDPNRSLVPTREEIAQLPRWARVAFAARCARRVLPLFRRGWPEAPAKSISGVKRTVELAERAAAVAGLDPDLAPTEAAQTIVLADTLTLRRAPSAAFAAAEVAFGAAETAYATVYAPRPDAANRETLAASRLAFKLICGFATLGTVRLVASPIRDFIRLVRLAKQQNWNDDTPVPPQVFGPMWDRGPPVWWTEDVTADLPPPATHPGLVGIDPGTGGG